MEQYSFNSVTGPMCESIVTTGEQFNNALITFGVTSIVLGAGLLAGDKKVGKAMLPLGALALLIAASRMLIPA